METTTEFQAKYPDPYSDMEGDWTVWDCRLASQRPAKPIAIPIAHCPSEEESLGTGKMPLPNTEHLAGYEVSQNPSKGAQPLCPLCHHHHLPGFGNCRD